MIKSTAHHDEKFAKMTFASVYPHYVNKISKKGRTEEELYEVISWLTGFSSSEIDQHIQTEITFQELFASAKLNPNAEKITGLICGYRVEEIENPLTKQVRYLDKLVDELAKGKSMEKILRS
jgi:hypothetical protein